MERERRGKAHLMSFLLAGLVFPTVITSVVSRSLEEFSDQKNYYSIPHSRTLQHPRKEPMLCFSPSHGCSSSPSHGTGGGYGLPAPSCGSGCGHESPSPSQGGGGSYGSQPPSQGGEGGHTSPTPSHGSGGSYNTPTPSGGSGGYHSSPPCSGGHSAPTIIPSLPPPVVVPPDTPSPGSGGSYGTPTPSHGSTGYYKPPPSSGGSPGPSPVVESPVTPPGSGGGYDTPTPSHGSGGYYNSPSTPSNGCHNAPPNNGCYNTPPSSPTIKPPATPTPTTPCTTPPSPLIPDPNSPPYFTGTCKYWKTHPEAILAILGYLGNIGQLFGEACSLAFGRDLSLPEALANTRTDGIGALYREGTASLLNSLVDSRFPFTTEQVKRSFAAAVTSDKAAATQAKLFKQANEGRLKF